VSHIAMIMRSSINLTELFQVVWAIGRFDSVAYRTSFSISLSTFGPVIGRPKKSSFILSKCRGGPTN
jgi:hypothetical protein